MGGTSNGKYVTPTLLSVAKGLIDAGFSLDDATAHFRRMMVCAALDANKGNRSRAAVTLRVHRNTLIRELARDVRPFDVRGK